MSKSYRLWTPIANAYEAYRRRWLAEPGAVYEHLWRLVHIHEALVVTLGSILATRLMDLWADSEAAQGNLNRLRTQITGIPEAEQAVDTVVYSTDSCLGGSIGAWINLLQAFGKAEYVSSCKYCESIAEYLAEQTQKPLAFAESWRRIAPVPSNYTEGLSRIQRFNAINQLRNKIAHVPLPYKLLEELHLGLRKEVLSSLSPKYDKNTDNLPRDFVTTDWCTPLKGKIIARASYLTGSDIGEDGACGDDVRLQPEMPGAKVLCWSGAPFFRTDQELKVSLLSRVPDLQKDPQAESLEGDYHRFASEFEPVQRCLIPGQLLAPWIPRPAKAITSEPEAGEATDTSRDHPATTVHDLAAKDIMSDAQNLRSSADQAFRIGDYPEAVRAFDVLAKTGDTRWYNDVAKSKHGAALWRAIEYSQIAEDKEQGIRRAISLLEAASRHSDPRYAARALYEKSKALWHLWRFKMDRELLDQALVSASEAAKLDFDPAYISWFERVDADRSS